MVSREEEDSLEDIKRRGLSRFKEKRGATKLEKTGWAFRGFRMGRGGGVNLPFRALI